MTSFLFVNLTIVATRNTFIATPRQGVNGQHYKQIETSQYWVKTKWLKKKTKQNNQKTGWGEGEIIFKAFLP